MSSLSTELRRGDVLKARAACTKMERVRGNVKAGCVRFWPKALVHEIYNSLCSFLVKEILEAQSPFAWATCGRELNAEPSDET